MERLVPQQYAREILQEHGIELSIHDTRTAAQYVTEMFVYIEAIKEEERSVRRLNEERYRSAQSQAPYFA